MQVIEIPSGSRFISAWELGRRIGALLHPTPDTPPLLVTLQKKIAEAEPGHYRIEELSDADVQYLRATWKGIDIPDALNMTREQWALCKAAFQSAPDRPVWDLVAGFRDYASEARSEQFRIANKHVHAMNALIGSGSMRAYDADLAPVQKVDGWGSQIPVDDAREYLANLGIELREQEPAVRRTVASILEWADQSTEHQAAEALAAGYRPPEGPYRRTLPIGKRFFTISECALETARALHPEQPDDPSSAKVKSFYLHEVSRPQQGFYPNDEQAQELNHIWNSAGLPRPTFPMERYTFDAYALALSRSARGSEWGLGADLTSRETHASTLRATTRKAHEEMLRQAVASGTVVLLHPGTLTTLGAAAAGENALIRAADVVKFAASMPVPIELVVPLVEAELQPAARVAAPAEQHAAALLGSVLLSEPMASVDDGVAPGPAPAEQVPSEGIEAVAEPLTREQIARAFGGAWKSPAEWTRYLSKGLPEWLAPAIAVRAQPRAKAGHRWNPVKFAELLRDKKSVLDVTLNRAFRTKDELASWRIAWEQAQSAFHEFGG
ncbi:hypothetical protein GALL_344290 [mine drainage metagenome]|uniref:Uncharacterized protein n=1 Tax=mine drainage metagenome TaxID=410659 RepID=A0A1J5QV85_9ZZZZ